MANQLALSVKYESLSGIEVSLDAKTVRDYLTRGNGNISDQECALFLRTCQAKKLDPMEEGEIFLIKYDNEKPAQMVVGYHAYLRRAEQFPDYMGFKAGVVVLRGDSTEPVYKEGAAVYKSIGEKLIGGWCRVRRNLHGEMCEMYTELSLDEYSTGKSNWAAKPGTMIRKCAISQAIRNAFPNEFEGLYTEEEITSAKLVNGEDYTIEPEPAEDPPTTQEQRQELMKAIDSSFSDKETKNSVFRNIMDTLGLKSTADMRQSHLETAREILETLAKQESAEEEGQESHPD